MASLVSGSNFSEFLSAFLKLRKLANSFFMSARLTVRPHGTIRLPLGGFSVQSTGIFFRKPAHKFQA